MASFTHTVPVKVGSTQLWSLVCDVPRLSGLFPFIVMEEINASGPNSWTYWRRLLIPNIASLRWREQAHITEDGELRFQAVDGDLHTFHGSWQVAADGSAAKLTLAVEYVVPDGVGPAIPAPMVNYVMSEMFKSICQRVKETAEEELG